MKEYIQPQAELIEYSFEDVIAGSLESGGNGVPEGGVGDGAAGGDGSF